MVFYHFTLQEEIANNNNNNNNNNNKMGFHEVGDQKKKELTANHNFPGLILHQDRSIFISIRQTRE